MNMTMLNREQQKQQHTRTEGRPRAHHQHAPHAILKYDRSLNCCAMCFHGVRSMETRRKVMTANAHARSIQAIAINPSGTLLATVGLDAKALVWLIRPVDDPQVPLKFDLAFTATIKDRPLIGVQFAGESLAVSCFDSYKLVLFPSKLPEEPSPKTAEAGPK
eukprot:m.110847 g.110847  ORF g.110847 m.110847 type:complete len:162 (+) comp13409_c0_seq9:886-1371(+)